MKILNKNRSSWASGRGYVPSCSIGFWVASTKNGSGRAWRRPPAVTWRSCIASSKAAWVLGGVRLISSARTRLAKIGPCTKRSSRAPRLTVFVEHLGAGDVAGHQVGRELDASEIERERLRQRMHHQRLRQPGHAFQDAVSAGEDGHQQLLDDVVLADDLPGHLLADLIVGFAQLFQFGQIDLIGRGGAQDRVSSSSAGKPAET